MKQILLITWIVLIILFAQVLTFAQTLYNGVGHIPPSYRETWTKAGLMSDATAITPKAVFVVTNMAGSNMDQKVAAAIAAASDHVSNTNGLGIVYFPEGEYYLDSTITLNQNYRNIVFQGAGSDKTTLVFHDIADENCFNLAGSPAVDWSSNCDLDQNFNKGDSILHAAAGEGLSTIAETNWVEFVKYNFSSPSQVVLGTEKT